MLTFYHALVTKLGARDVGMRFDAWSQAAQFGEETEEQRKPAFSSPEF